MTDVIKQVEEINAKLDALTAKVDALATPTATDLAPVLEAIAEVKTHLVDETVAAPDAPVEGA